MLLDQNIGFHESTINSIKRHGDEVTLNLEGVQIGNEKKSGVLHVFGLRDLVCDGFDVSNFEELEEGEVLTLSLEGSRLNLIVECTDFARHVRSTYSCNSFYDSAEFEAYS